MKDKAKENQKRYKLHAKARALGFVLVTRKRTFFMHYLTKNIPDCVITLRDKYGYSIQTEIV